MARSSYGNVIFSRSHLERITDSLHGVLSVDTAREGYYIHVAVMDALTADLLWPIRTNRQQGMRTKANHKRVFKVLRRPVEQRSALEVEYEKYCLKRKYEEKGEGAA